MRGYQIRALSQYEGEKWTEEQSERIAEGDLKKDANLFKFKRPPVNGYLCDRCKGYKRTSELIRIKPELESRLGARRPGMRGKYIQCCEECAREIEHHVSDGLAVTKYRQNAAEAERGRQRN